MLVYLTNTWHEEEKVLKYMDKAGIQGIYKEDDIWLVEIPSIEWAVDQWGHLVVSKDTPYSSILTVEIYDSYRE